MTANYWDYATGSNSVPNATSGGTTPDSAVYSGSSPTDVNNAGGLSAYGTMGQNGNVYEFLESAYDGVNDSSLEDRALRGGYWADTGGTLRSSWRGAFSGPVGLSGFRVASVVPEPSSAMLMLGSGLMFSLRRRRGSAL